MVWLLSTLILALLAAQCNALPTPPLPVSPGGPAVRIALLSPSTGELATFGRRVRNGSIMAFDKWNARGGLLNRRIEWVTFDTNCEYETARQATQQAIDGGLQFIIGPVCSEAAIAAAELAESAQVLMISPTATHPLVTVDGQGHTRSTVFRATFAYPRQGEAAAHFAYNTLKANKAALFFDPRDDYATKLAEVFAQRFTAEGGQIVYRATYTSDETDLSDSLTASSRAGAEVIYLPAPAQVVNRVAGQLSSPDLSVLSANTQTGLVLLGSDSWESTELDLAATAGSYFTVYFVSASNHPTTQAWAESYKSIYAIEPDTLAALGYDAAIFLTGAIQQAGTFEPVAVAKALEQGKFDSLTGQITFDHRHNPIKPVPIVQVTKDEGMTFSAYVSP